MSDSKKLSQEEYDRRFMAASLRYAHRHRGLTGTNPAVGTILVDYAKSVPEIIGAGATAIGGRPHAETVALYEAGERAKGATAYVSLEPCAHHGGTPPCAKALIDAGVSRVVTAYVDPDQRVDGKGHQMLRDAGIQVDTGLLSDVAAWDMRGYLSRVKRNRPHVMVKLAMTSDGYLGISGQSQGLGQVKITGEEAKRQTHLLRMQSDGILVGKNTVVDDAPQLSVRLSGLSHYSPKPFVLANSALPDGTDLPQGAVLIGSERKCHEKWRSQGTQFIGIENLHGQLALADLLEDLAQLGIASLMVEGGAITAGHFLDADLVDELVLYEAPNPLKDLIAEGDMENAIATPISSQTIGGEWQLREMRQLGKDKMTVWSK